MGLGHQGDGADLLAGSDAVHVHDLHSGGDDIVVGVQSQVEAGDVTAAVAGAADDGGALLVLDHRVVVGHLEHVDLRVIVQNLLGGVGAVLLVELGVHTHVGGDHDHVGLVADGGDGGLDGGVGGLIGAGLHTLLAAVPDGHVGGDHADDGHLHAVPLHDGPAGAGDEFTAGVLHVGGQNGEVGLAGDGLHGVDAPVELVVAQSHGVIAHEVHGGDDGVGLIGGLVVEVVGHDGALDVITGVDEDGVGVLGPDLLDVGVEAGHAVVGGLFIVLIGVTPDIAVHIGGAKDGDVLFAFSGQSGGEGGGQHGDSQCAGQELAETVVHLCFSFLLNMKWGTDTVYLSPGKKSIVICYIL